MRTSEAIRLLDSQSQYTGILRGRRDDWPKFNSWQRETEIKLERIFGPGCKHVRTFKSIRYSPGVISVGSGRNLAEEERYWNQGLDEAQEFFRILKDEVRRSSSFGVLRLPRKGGGAAADEKITVRWLMSHLPISYVIAGIAAFVTVFLAGVRVGQIRAVKEVLDALFKQ